MLDMLPAIRTRTAVLFSKRDLFRHLLQQGQCTRGMMGSISFSEPSSEISEPPWYALQSSLTVPNFSWASVRDLFQGNGSHAYDVEATVDSSGPAPTEYDAWGFRELCQCSRSQRLLLFAMLFGTGVVVSFLSVGMLPMLILRPQKFAFAFSLGQVLLITSTWLVVPLQVQLRALSVTERASAAAMYGIALVLALVTSLRHLALLALCFVLIQLSALAWYLLTFLPFGRGWLWAWFSSATGLHRLDGSVQAPWRWMPSSVSGGN